jgi:hypothetical protein
MGRVVVVREGCAGARAIRHHHAGALERLRAEDERLGGDAEAAFNSLTWDEGLETVTQYGVQRFLWSELPRRSWRSPAASCVRAAGAGGRRST